VASGLVEIEEFGVESELSSAAGLLILCAGFEERASAFMERAQLPRNPYCILLTFESTDPENLAAKERFGDLIALNISLERFYSFDIKSSTPEDLELDFADVLGRIPAVDGEIWVDISGMPSHAICCVLKRCRELYPALPQTVVYSSAQQYSPSIDEYERLLKKQKQGVEFLPTSMAQGMDKILFLESFSGHRNREGAGLLAVFCGYDVPRSIGVINGLNPAKILMLYGKPGNKDLNWRLKLSQTLHENIQNSRSTASEVVSTLELSESFSVLAEYYDFMYDEYDMIIAPVCSKMQVVAAFLFWERHKEIQLVFPQPVSYV
jgi:hypothetical protein